MIRHATTATPWWTLGVAAVLLAVLLRVVEQWPYTMWPLEGVAVGLLAATATWPFDEPAAAVVDSLPRGLAWQTMARAGGVVALVAWWLLLVRWTEAAYFGHAWSVALQGCAAVLGAVAFVSWRRSQGSAAPARAMAPATVAATTFVAVARPMDQHLPVFPYTAGGPWAASALLWSGLALVAVVVLVVVLSETGRPRRAVQQAAAGPSPGCPPRRIHAGR